MPATDGRQQARRQRGADGERIARAHLERHGLQCLDAGWRCRLGELDLVMRDGGILVFVEVRARAAGSLVDAIESVDVHKQRRFVRAARAWLASHPDAASLPARLDVVAIAGDDVRWLRNAIETTAT